MTVRIVHLADRFEVDLDKVVWVDRKGSKPGGADRWRALIKTYRYRIAKCRVRQAKEKLKRTSHLKVFRTKFHEKRIRDHSVGVRAGQKVCLTRYMAIGSLVSADQPLTGA